MFARQGGKASQSRALRILFLLCAGSYATDFGMVLIGSNDPPSEAVFLFLALKVPMLPA
ncbi:hypothetical protein [Mesorhizobium sp. M1027]|uniref:hypothetical protein n=1 Tax=Mesorhizobium sp. M1027 TaxID=2957050 RepID=UPI0033350799